MRRLAIRLLGAPQIEIDGSPVELETRKATALLAYPALRPGQVSRDTLATLFWPDHDQTRAFANLRRTLWSLNQSPGADWVEAGQAAVSLSRHHGLWVDAGHFRTRVLGCPVRSRCCSQCIAAALPGSHEFAEVAFERASEGVAGMHGGGQSARTRTESWSQ